jgi:hypothetical protein
MIFFGHLVAVRFKSAAKLNNDCPASIHRVSQFAAKPMASPIAVEPCEDRASSRGRRRTKKTAAEDHLAPPPVFGFNRILLSA